MLGRGHISDLHSAPGLCSIHLVAPYSSRPSVTSLQLPAEEIVYESCGRSNGPVLKAATHVFLHIPLVTVAWPPPTVLETRKYDLGPG